MRTNTVRAQRAHPQIGTSLLLELSTAAAKWAPINQREDATQCAALKIIEAHALNPLASRDELLRAAQSGVRNNRRAEAKAHGITREGQTYQMIPLEDYVASEDADDTVMDDYDNE